MASQSTRMRGEDGCVGPAPLTAPCPCDGELESTGDEWRVTDQTCRETLQRLAFQWLASEGHSLLGKSCATWLAASCRLATSSKMQSPPAPLFQPPLLILPWRLSNPGPGFPCPSLHTWAILFISLLRVHHAWPFWATRERRFVEPTTKKAPPMPPWLCISDSTSQALSLRSPPARFCKHSSVPHVYLLFPANPQPRNPHISALPTVAFPCLSTTLSQD
jgi:hypothetical protein